jgi:hypothetical protein
MPTFPQYISGKTVVNSPFSASADRYSFLSLENAEPNLGAPTGAPGFYTLVSDPVSGVRLWQNLAALTSVPVAGLDTQIIFNSGGVLVGNNGLTFNYNLSTITAGQCNLNNFTNSFIFGCSLTSVQPDYTFVNNLSTPGFIEGFIAELQALYVTQGYSGFGTLTPNEKVTIVGNLSVTDTIYGRVSAEPTLPRLAEDTQVIFNSGGNLTGLSAFNFIYSVSGLKVGTCHYLPSTSKFSGILGGSCNTVNACYAGVTFGQFNSAGANHSATVGGCNNFANGSKAFIGAGSGNNAVNGYATVVGGQDNCSAGVASFIGGGRENISNSDYSAVLGGYGNSTGDTYSTVGGGLDNTIDGGGIWAFIGGGNSNYVNGSYNVIAGGNNNAVVSNCGGILGGTTNCVQHVNSFIIGSNLKTQAVCTTFVNNLSTCGSICANFICANTISVSGFSFCNPTISQTATATDAFLTLTVCGSALALPLFRIG